MILAMKMLATVGLGFILLALLIRLLQQQGLVFT